ncbi:MAG: hypothetical protein K2X01_03845 [Cyanobacteria bacterium]|nr:hypothetical protein [Cyanobacteriota bacterium]
MSEPENINPERPTEVSLTPQPGRRRQRKPRPILSPEDRVSRALWQHNPKPIQRIYPHSGATAIVGRAWSLFRRFPKESVLLMMPPTFLNLIVAIMASYPASAPLRDRINPTYIAVSVVTMLAAMLLSMLAGIVSVFFFFVLIRFYYSRLIQEDPITLKEAITQSINRWKSITFSVLLAFVGYLFFAVVDIVAITIEFILFAFAISNLMKVNPGLGAGGMALLMLVIGIQLFVMLGFQAMLLLIPVTALACTETEKRLVDTVIESYKVIFGQPLRSAWFGIALGTTAIVMSMVVNIPVSIGLLQMMQGGDKGYVPFHLSVLASAASNLFHLVLFPFLMGALTLFWYDGTVRRLGADLHLQLQRLEQEHTVESPL